ncbi:30S ribosomal protein S6 [Patescibacteria group bacterium]|nr:30S ribosomal protein S6 [Patescibacteria group bacterium]
MYELIFITDSLAGSIDNEAIGKVRSLIGNLGGGIKKEEIREKQKLAYPVKKRLAGCYVVFEFEMETEKIAELQNQLRQDSSILRFLIINKKGVKPEPTRSRPSRAKVTAASMPAGEDKGEKVKIEELDKKLEEILKE